MRALCYHGKGDMRIDTVPDPKIVDPRDIILKVTACAICGSDLHIFDGYTPTMETGDIIGHEFMGEVAEVGRDVKNLKVGDRVVVPFNISCGDCFFCKKRCSRSAITQTRRKRLRPKSWAIARPVCSAIHIC